MADEAVVERLNNWVGLTIAILATFLALVAIKSGNVAQAMEQAQAERNNGWAWYQAVRVREDMATYESAHLKREQREQGPDHVSNEEIAAQEAEVARIRARLNETQTLAKAAEAEHAALSVFDDQYDLATALITIAMSMLAVCVVVKLPWLYWVSLVPALGGLFWGVAAMAQWPIRADVFFAWLI